ncbi:MGMT family protein [Micrococcaceae bacterium RIT802]|jgi:alkylated DNA nucleotide flippase Atl1|nr:MGMT family protein [Micrococcaceae bacterium RIT 802]
MSLEYAEAVHRVAGRIPAGSVLTYGDIAELLGSGGPRQVGAAMSRSPGPLPWWRVLRANGTLPADLQQRALPHWAEEQIPMLRGRVRVTQARWRPDDGGFNFLDAVAAALAEGTGAGTAPNRQGEVF